MPSIKIAVFWFIQFFIFNTNFDIKTVLPKLSLVGFVFGSIAISFAVVGVVAVVSVVDAVVVVQFLMSRSDDEFCFSQVESKERSEKNEKTLKFMVETKKI